MSILLFSKRREDFYFQKAYDFIKLNCEDVVLVQGLPGEPFPREYLSWEGDYILSYLCPNITKSEKGGHQFPSRTATISWDGMHELRALS